MYMDVYKNWISNDYFDEETKKELKSIEGNKREIEDRFYKNLEFGTGGLRGLIGYGTNRINKYTIRRATFGLANYIIKKYGQDGKDKGVVIAYDSRYKSEEFCIEAGKTLAACGIKVYIFDDLRPTPQLSFSVRKLGCIAGIVITASHNPKEYNGYKVYGQDGGQVCPLIASEIIEEVNKIEDYSKIPTIDYEEAKLNKLIKILDEDIDKAYIEAVKEESIRRDIIKQTGKNLKIIYTPIHGSGNKPVRRVLDEIGFEKVYVVKEQELPDCNFSTVKYPNPEEKEVFDIAIEIARRENADLIIGTDPDCDRVGVVVKNKSNEYVVLTGNQVGALLVNYVLENLAKENKLLKNSTIIKTIVTSELGAEIAKSYGVDCINTLTGFKYIGEKINEFEKNNNKIFILGFEESYGYLKGTYARDKDAVVASLLIAEMAAFYYSKHMSLYEGLIELYEKYGYYEEDLISISLKGIDGMHKMNEIMKFFRKGNLFSINETQITNVYDYNNGIGDLPKADVLKFSLEDNSWIVIRPSGTEPKLKIYIGCNGLNKNEVKEKVKKYRDCIKELINIFI